MDVSLPAQVRRKTDALVVEYVGAISAGRIFSVAAKTARSMVRTASADPDFLERWEARVRQVLIDELADELAHPAAQARSSVMR